MVFVRPWGMGASGALDLPLEKLSNQWNSDRRSRQSRPILNTVAMPSKAELAATSVWFVGFWRWRWWLRRFGPSFWSSSDPA